MPCLILRILTRMRAGPGWGRASNPYSFLSQYQPVHLVPKPELGNEEQVTQPSTLNPLPLHLVFNQFAEEFGAAGFEGVVGEAADGR
jgi:hypothetical protein